MEKEVNMGGVIQTLLALEAMRRANTVQATSTAERRQALREAAAQVQRDLAVCLEFLNSNPRPE